MNRRGFLGAAGIWAAAASNAAQGGATGDGASFHYGPDECRLADILAPTAPYGLEAAGAVKRLIDGADLELRDVADRDRWGRRIVRAFVRGDAAQGSLQETLVADGAARVSPESADHAAITALLAREAAAREQRRGLWRLRDYRVRAAVDASAAIGAFQLVEGVVVSAFIGRGRAYLNFGGDYRSDFTASAGSRDARR